MSQSVPRLWPGMGWGCFGGPLCFTRRCAGGSSVSELFVGPREILAPLVQSSLRQTSELRATLLRTLFVALKRELFAIIDGFEGVPYAGRCGTLFSRSSCPAFSRTTFGVRSDGHGAGATRGARCTLFAFYHGGGKRRLV